jgi:Protein of unknown function (DUF3137)
MLYHNFRLFYNQVIHPELLHMEHRRRRLVRLLLLSVLLMVAVVTIQIYVRIFLVMLLLLIPVGCWVAYLVFRVQVYYAEFKPRIVGLILDFIDNDVNYSQLQYEAKGTVSVECLLESKIFVHADDFSGEDLITGQVRETPFQMSELRVNEFSEVRNKLDRVFHGIFLTGDFHNLEMKGAVLVLPDSNMRYLGRSEKAFHLYGGRRQHNLLLPEFETFFNTYATPETRLHDVLSDDFQRAILDFRMHYQEMNRQKEMYLSIIGDNIYIALSQDRDLLEPSIFASNVSFEVVQEFYTDIAMLLELVKKVDVMN